MIRTKGRPVDPQRRRKFLSLESLEERTVLAGNVFATIAGGSLYLIGDNSANAVAVENVGTNGLRLTSLDGSTRINGQAGPITLNGFSQNIIALTSGGDDTLRFEGTADSPLRANGNVIIDMGNGNDTVGFSNVSIGRSLILTTGNGDDTVVGLRDLDNIGASTGIGLRVGQDAIINTGAGNDNVEFRNSAFLRNHFLDAGLGNDKVDVRGTQFGLIAFINGSSGADRLNFAVNTSRIQPVVLGVETRTALAGPVVAADAGVVLEGGAAALSILANDTATSGPIDPSTLLITQPPIHGSLQIAADGTVTYQHDGSESLNDSFRYTVRDSQNNLSNEALVSITVTPINDLPVAGNDTLTLNEGASGQINLAANDTDAEGRLNLNSIVILSGPTNGTLSAAANGQLVYTHNGSETTTDSFTYTIADTQGGVSNTATVNITVNPLNDAPNLNDLVPVTISEDGTATVNLTLNDAETAAAALGLSVTSSNPALVPNDPVNLTISGSGSSRQVLITPLANAFGESTISVSVSDGQGGVTTKTFLLTVASVNDGPSISAVANISTNEDTAVTLPTITVNDVETPVANLAVTATSSNTAIFDPATGLSVVANGNQRTVVLTPVANASGTVDVTLRVADGDAGFALRTFTLTVAEVNDAPTINALTDLTLQEGATIDPVNLTIGDVETLADVTVGATSSDDNVATVALSGTGAARVLTINPIGAGTTTVTVTVDDTHGGVTVKQFNVTINAAPTISAAANVTVNEDDPIPPFDITVGDSETAAASLTVTAESSNPDLIASSNIQIVANGATRTITIDPPENADGTAVITLMVDDGNGGTAQTQFTLTVNAVNDLPTINPVADITVDEDTTVTANVTIGDVETPLDLLNPTASVTATTNVNLVQSVNVTGTGANRVVTIVPTAEAAGTATIKLSVTDNSGETVDEFFDVTFRAVNDPVVAADDFLDVDEGGQVSFDAHDLALNDLDNDGTIDELTLAIPGLSVGTPVQLPHGTLTANANGTFTYTHDGSETLSDSFTYSIKNTNGDLSNTATVHLTVNPINDVPVATDPASLIFQVQDSAPNRTVSGNVLASVSDPDGPLPATIQSFTYFDAQGNQQTGTVGTQVTTETGRFKLNADGSFTYSWNPVQFVGSDSFVVDLFDGQDHGFANITVIILGSGLPT